MELLEARDDLLVHWLEKSFDIRGRNFTLMKSSASGKSSSKS